MAIVSFQFYFWWVHSSVFLVPSLLLKRIFQGCYLKMFSRWSCGTRMTGGKRRRTEYLRGEDWTNRRPAITDPDVKWKSYQAHFLFGVLYQDFRHRHALPILKLLYEIVSLAVVMLIKGLLVKSMLVKPDLITIVIAKFKFEGFISATSRK